MALIRRATAEDAPFMQEMLTVAADWRPGARVRPVSEIMGIPALAHYISGWPTKHDVGFVAEEENALGAAWWRFFPQHDSGYGFVDEATPEVSIGVVQEARRRRIGTILMQALIDEAEGCGLPAMSLSVEGDNPTVSLYRRLGFVTVGQTEGSLTMILRLG